MARVRVCRVCLRSTPMPIALVETYTGFGYQAYELRVCKTCWLVFETMLEEARVAVPTLNRHQLELAGFAP